jgi:cell volume regulation protein A
VILFNGGTLVGSRRFRVAAVPIFSLGVLGTFATAGVIAVAAHYLFDFSGRLPASWALRLPPPTRR